MCVCVYIWLNIFLSKNDVILTPNYEPFCIKDQIMPLIPHKHLYLYLEFKLVRSLSHNFSLIEVNFFT